jgi:DNA-binding helix-hairpin-helix protein with protein kinase domain
MSDEEERLVQADPEVLEGDDELPRQPVSDRDPFVPEPHPRPGERREWRVMRLAALVVAALILVIVLYAILR